MGGSDMHSLSIKFQLWLIQILTGLRGKGNISLLEIAYKGFVVECSV